MGTIPPRNFDRSFTVNEDIEMSFLDNYTPVNERLIQALHKYPELSVAEEGYTVVTIGEQTFLECVVWVYRTPTDERPIRGSVLEPFPGRTPYTKNSELMVGMTSALGRALGYLGFGIEKGIASDDEVRARRDTVDYLDPNTTPEFEVRRTGKPTAKMVGFLRSLENRTGQTADPGAADDFELCRAEIDRLQGK
jgi:hypothetical protein